MDCGVSVGTQWSDRFGGDGIRGAALPAAFGLLDERIRSLGGDVPGSGDGHERFESREMDAGRRRCKRIVRGVRMQQRRGRVQHEQQQSEQQRQGARRGGPGGHEGSNRSRRRSVSCHTVVRNGS